MSRVYDISEVQLFILLGRGVYSYGNDQWRIVSANATHEDFEDDGKNYSSALYWVNAKRKPYYCLTTIVFPCTLLSIMSLLMFCLPADNGDKISLGITVFLTFSVFQLLIADIMPRTSENSPYIGWYT